MVDRREEHDGIGIASSDNSRNTRKQSSFPLLYKKLERYSYTQHVQQYSKSRSIDIQQCLHLGRGARLGSRSSRDDARRNGHRVGSTVQEINMPRGLIDGKFL